MKRAWSAWTLALEPHYPGPPVERLNQQMRR